MNATIRIFIHASTTGWTAQIEGEQRRYYAEGRHDPRDLAAKAALEFTGFVANLDDAQRLAREYKFRIRHICSDADEEVFEAEVNDDWRRFYAPQA